MILTIALSFSAAVVDWYAVATRRRQLEYVAKPLTMVILLVGAILAGGFLTSPIGRIFALGLVLSLVGDVFLMIPGRFIPGLAAFLAAHLAYIVAFNLGGPVISPPSLLLAGVIALVAAWVLVRVRSGLLSSGRQRLWLPVLVYGVVLATTLWSAYSSLLRPDWSTGAAILLSLGGTLFFVSDAGNAWQRFVRDFSGLRLIVMISYHLAQLLLTAAVFLQLQA
jgi:uncharacterized membrane protein YhhN